MPFQEASHTPSFGGLGLRTGAPIMSAPKRYESSFGPLFDMPNVLGNGTNPLNGAQSSGRAPTVVDVFCGSGGLTLGLVEAGFDCVGAFEHWGPAVKTFGLNICDSVKDLDLTEKPPIPNCDVIAGGPPCQGFSSAGRRQGSDPKPIPRWDVHFGILKTTEETQRLVISPLVATRVGTDSVVLRYVHFTLALV